MEQRLTITDRFLYSLIKSYTQRHQPFVADNKIIAYELGKSTETISHSITRLTKLGYIRNSGTKFSRELFVVKPLLSNIHKNICICEKSQISQQENADFDIRNADFDIRSVKNYIRNAVFDIKNAENCIKNVKAFLKNADFDIFPIKYDTEYLISVIDNIIYIYNKLNNKNNININNNKYSSSSSSSKEDKEKFLPLNHQLPQCTEGQTRQEGEKKDNTPSECKKDEPLVITRIKTWWNEIIVPTFNLAKIFNISGIRRDDLMSRMYDCGGEEKFKKALYDALGDLLVKGDGFMFGENKRHWKMDFDWIMTEKNFNALIEKKYLHSQEKRNIIIKDK